MSTIAQEIHDRILAGEYKKIDKAIEKALKKGLEPQNIVKEMISSAMTEVVRKFSIGHVHLPDLLLSVKTMQSALHVLEKITGEYRGSLNEDHMMIMTYDDHKHDLGKYLVSVIAVSMGIKVIDPDRPRDNESLKKYNEKNKPSIIGLSGQPSDLFSRVSMYSAILTDPDYKDKASFIVFSPPVTASRKDRMRVEIYSDFSKKTVRKFIGILEEAFFKINI